MVSAQCSPLLELACELPFPELLYEPSLIELSCELLMLEPVHDASSTVSLLKQFFHAPIALSMLCGAFFIIVRFIRRWEGRSSIVNRLLERGWSLSGMGIVGEGGSFDLFSISLSNITASNMLAASYLILCPLSMESSSLSSYSSLICGLEVGAVPVGVSRRVSLSCP